MTGEPLLLVSGLTKDFGRQAGLFGGRGRWLRAVDDVGFHIAPGETLGIVGESGSGKTTVARLVLRLLAPTAGSIRFEGQELTALDQAGMRPLRRHVQVVFQDPYSSLNPRLRVRDVIGEPLRNFGHGERAVTERVAEVMQITGLPPALMTRYPHAFSGGQRQRIGIARALALNPKLIVCDEAVSALDVSIQAQILNLLQDIQARFGLALMFISHNLAVVRHVSHRVAVMYLGQVVELADEADLFSDPQHPYTRALIAAVPEPDPQRCNDPVPLEGEIPDPTDPPRGCRFRTRCPVARERCTAEAPAIRALAPGRWVRCHFPGEAPFS